MTPEAFRRLQEGRRPPRPVGPQERAARQRVSLLSLVNLALWLWLLPWAVAGVVVAAIPRYRSLAVLPFLAVLLLLLIIRRNRRKIRAAETMAAQFARERR